MNPTGSGLKEIHDLREKLEEVAGQIDRGPRQIAARQQLLDKKKADLEARRDKLKQLKVAADQKNLQLKSSEGKIHDLQGKLNAVSTNREYDALRSQIAADKMANSVLEDEIIEALERVDAMQAEVKQVEQEVAKSQEEIAQFSAQIKQQEPELRQRAGELEAKLSNVETMLPADIVPMYRRLVQAYGARALAPVVGKACGECFVGLTAQTVVELRSGKFKFCTCGRLMYLAEDA